MLRFFRRFSKPGFTPSPPRDGLTLADLNRALGTTKPAAVLASPRILRRVIRHQCDIAGPGFHLPHSDSFVLPRADLLKLVEKAELGKEPVDPLPDPVILLRQPDAEDLQEASANVVLARYWRMLFHGAVHAVLEKKFSAKEVSPVQLRKWIHQIGFTEFAEIRLVLEQENLLLPPVDDQTTFIEFAATYLELRHFAPSFLERFFPGITHHENVEKVLDGIVNSKDLFRRTRPQNTPRPTDHPDSEQLEIQPSAGEAQDHLPAALPHQPSKEEYKKLARRAEKATAKGNQVRGCIYWTQARRVAPVQARKRTRAAASATLDRLIQRLHSALGLQEADHHIWRGPLTELVAHAATGKWTAETRLLYDLQKVCVDIERNVYAVDPIGWVLSAGRRPLKRPLPRQRDVLTCRHLHTAARRLTVVRLTNEHRHTLHRLLREAADSSERRLRDRFRPLLRHTLDEVGLVARCAPESVESQKLVEELLDRTIERGFLTLGDWRDALARNDLKLPDFRGVEDLVRGDPLLRADRRLSRILDGVYRRGEIYLRWLQLLTSLAFATAVGRFLTQYVVVPFGGAYITDEFYRHLLFKITHVPLATDRFLVVWLGLFVLGLMHWPPLRQATLSVLRRLAEGIRYLFMDLPRIMMNKPWFRRIVQSRLFRWGDRFFVRPLVISTALCWIMPWIIPAWNNSFFTRGLVFAGLNLLINSRLGRNLEEVAIESLVQLWKHIGFHMLIRIFWGIMDFFHAAVEYAERVLYQVDEWLRFRGGEQRLSLMVKAILNPIWRMISYVVRFCITLLIEPQINPIKHFPVVTVSHKLLLPTIPWVLAPILTPVVGKETAGLISLGVATAIPGVFGFLVWELRENWRLYEANRPHTLSPAVIGRHGETMLRLLRPGFHSGTIPKQFAKLRAAEHAGWVKGKWSGVRKHLHVLQEVEISIRRYLEREFLRLLNETPSWRKYPIQVGSLHLSTNRVAIELFTGKNRSSVGRLVFELRSDRLLASVSGDAWLASLSEQQKRLLGAALTGAYKTSGVQLTREEIESQLPSPPPPYDVLSKELMVWPGGLFDSEARYLLHSEDEDELIEPQTVRGSPGPLPVLNRSRLFLKNFPVLWENWVRVWEQAHQPHLGAEQKGEIESLTPVHVLPEEKVALVKSTA